jgi:uracil-DNA glycosylase family 4
MEAKMLNKYILLLNAIYSRSVVDNLIEVDRNSIKFKNQVALESYIDKYKRKPEEGCQICRSKISNFVKRKMDFPSWSNELNCNLKNRKLIMLIGEDVSPKIPRVINIAYDLSRRDIDENGNVENSARNPLWKYLKELFGNSFEDLKNNIYITDICKCNANKKKDIWEQCSRHYLMNEIEIINPSLIIFQGASAFKYVQKMSKFNENYSIMKNYFSKTSFYRHGTLTFNSKKFNYFRIYHSSNMNNKNKYIEFNKAKKFINEIIAKLVFSNGA